MFWESCSSSYTENNKIEFAIFGFSYDFIRFFKVIAKTHKRGRYILLEDPWNFLNLTNLPLPLAHRTLQDLNQCTGIPAAQGSSPPARERWSWATSGT
jgi:hypothetical protein